MTEAIATGHLQVIGGRGQRKWRAFWWDADGKHSRVLGRAWVKDSGRKTPRGAPIWHRADGPKPDASYLTPSEARGQLGRICAEASRVSPRLAQRDGVSFRDAAEAWYRDRELEKGCRPSTLRDYRSQLDSRLLPAFESEDGRSLPLSEVTSEQIVRWRRTLQAESRLSPRTINKLRMSLHGIFEHARRPVADGGFGLGDNPVSGTRKVPGETRIERLRFFTPEQIDALARAAKDGRHRVERTGGEGETEARERALENCQDAALFITAGHAGLRLGELLALRWSDVDWSNGKIMVWRSFTAGIEGPTKDNEPRPVPMADDVATALTGLASLREDVARQSGRPSSTDSECLVFCNRLGGHIDGSALRRRFLRARDVAELPELSFHTLRHSFASAALRVFPPFAVQEFLGHRDGRTTKIYSHLMPDVGEAERLSSAFALARTTDQGPRAQVSEDDPPSTEGDKRGEAPDRRPKNS